MNPPADIDSQPDRGVSSAGSGTMRAARIVEPRTVVIEEAPAPRPAANQVRIRVEGCGVCASNIPPWEGRPWFNYPLEPGQLGHEGWGRVDQVGPGVSNVSPGDRVAFLSNHAYAQYDVADAGAVVRLPESLDDEPFPGEPLGCAMNILARSAIEPGQTVAIVGLGFLGCLLTQLAVRVGARVIAVSRRPYSLHVARSMGARHAVTLARQHQAVEAVSELTDGRMCPRVIEATGKQEGLDLAGELTAERGRLVIAGYHQDGLRQVNMQQWNWRGLDVINAHEREEGVYVAGIAAAVTAVGEGRLDPAPLYTGWYRLDQLDSALEAARDRPDGMIKALVLMDGL